MELTHLELAKNENMDQKKKIYQTVILCCEFQSEYPIFEGPFSGLGKMCVISAFLMIFSDFYLVHYEKYTIVT